MMKVQFTVTGEPQGKARPRILRNGRAYTPKKTADYENRIRRAFTAAGGELTAHPVTVRIAAYYQIPKSASRARRAEMLEGVTLPTKKPDADNVAKVVCDAMNGIAYKDDAQVCELHVMKYYAAVPMIVVTVSELIQ